MTVRCLRGKAEITQNKNHTITEIMQTQNSWADAAEAADRLGRL